MKRLENRVNALEQEMKPGMPDVIHGHWGLGGYFFWYNHGRELTPLTPQQVEAHVESQREAIELHNLPAVIEVTYTTLDEMKEYWRRMGIEGTHFAELVAKYEKMDAENAERERALLEKAGLST